MAGDWRAADAGVYGASEDVQGRAATRLTSGWCGGYVSGDAGEFHIPMVGVQREGWHGTGMPTYEGGRWEGCGELVAGGL